MEHNPSHQQTIGSPFYLAWPCPTKQYPVFSTTSNSHQGACQPHPLEGRQQKQEELQSHSYHIETTSQKVIKKNSHRVIITIILNFIYMCQCTVLMFFFLVYFTLYNRLEGYLNMIKFVEHFSKFRLTCAFLSPNHSG